MESKPHILLLESITDAAKELLSAQTKVWEAFDPDSSLELAQKYAIQGIVTRGKGQIDSRLISACSQLRAIVRCGVGLDNIAIHTASQQGVAVLNLPGSNADTVAEHALALMLSLKRQLFLSIRAVKQDDWAYRNRYQGDEVRGKTLGILGLGNIGERVATLAQAFGMKVHYWGTGKKANSPYSYLELPELLATSDILSIHLPLNEATTGLLNQAALQSMRRGAMIVNTSRGAIIEEAALMESLRDGHLGGYAADVLHTEPPASKYPLLELDNVLITPHSASLTHTTYEHMCLVSVQNLLALIAGEAVADKYIFNKSQL